MIEGRDPLHHYTSTARMFAVLLCMSSAVDAQRKPASDDWTALASLVIGRLDHDLPESLRGHMSLMLEKHRGAKANLMECQFGGGAGNRTRVRMMSNKRVYVRRFRSISV